MARIPLFALLALLTGCPSTPTDQKPDTGEGPIEAVDEDGDGYLISEGDCDDDDPKLNPGQTELCDGLDNDCDGVADDGVLVTYYVDADGDGFGDESTPMQACEVPDGYVVTGGDCDDTDERFHPEAEEPCTEGVDYDCDGTVEYEDLDGDGAAACVDCDDLDPDVAPGAAELCNGLDDDCDGEIDPDSSIDAPVWYADVDADTYGDLTTAAPACSAPAGRVADASDCDDTRDFVHPGAAEVCDGLDDDCDTLVDDADPDLDLTTGTSWYADADGDGYGPDASAVLACVAPAGTVGLGGDCDDGSTDYHPGAPETDCADPADYNCDGSVAYADADADGWAACVECDDANAAVYPGATELCNGLDDDCDGTVDPDTASDAATWYADADGDTYGDPGVPSRACAAPSGSVADATDCNDADLAIHPGATELCNGLDDDCDGTIDPDTSADALTWYADADGDTYGDPASTAPGCAAPAGYGTDTSDCDDTDADVHPGADEACNGIDDDCDGTIDPDTAVDALTWYADTDGDSYGDAGSTVLACAEPAGYLADDTDCDDTRADVNPGETEVCDAADTDENCNGLADDADGTTDPTSMTAWYTDADTDGWGDPATVTYACDAPAGLVSDGTDCDDTRSGVHPTASEYCDALDVDEDCDGLADDDDPGVDPTTYDTWYEDADGDSYGGAASVGACDLPSGYCGSPDDCDDTDASIHPDQTDDCNDVDDDCDGSVDEDGTSAVTVTISAYDSVCTDLGTRAVWRDNRVRAYNNGTYDLTGWTSFDLSSLPADAVLDTVTLWLHGEVGFGSPMGGPRVVVYRSADDGWRRGTVAYNDISRDDLVSSTTTTTFTATGWNSFDLDPSAWAYEDDVADGWITLGIDNTYAAYSYVYFYGTDNAATKPELEITYFGCE